jgi:hypothetical protein
LDWTVRHLMLLTKDHKSNRHVSAPRSVVADRPVVRDVVVERVQAAAPRGIVGMGAAVRDDGGIIGGNNVSEDTACCHLVGRF